MAATPVRGERLPLHRPGYPLMPRPRSPSTPTEAERGRRTRDARKAYLAALERAVLDMRYNEMEWGEWYLAHEETIARVDARSRAERKALAEQPD
jgi:hypothetical protein